jgi:hypothetical protein
VFNLEPSEKGASLNIFKKYFPTKPEALLNLGKFTLNAEMSKLGSGREP